MGLDVRGFYREIQNFHIVLKAVAQKDAEKARKAMDAPVDYYAAQGKINFYKRGIPCVQNWRPNAYPITIC